MAQLKVRARVYLSDGPKDKDNNEKMKENSNVKSLFIVSPSTDSLSRQRSEKQGEEPLSLLYFIKLTSQSRQVETGRQK